MVADSPHVAFRAVVKRFRKGATVLENISVTIARGEFVSVLGPSGCGKSTLLRLIAGLSPVTYGQVLVDGRPPEPGQSGTAFIFQEPTLLPWLNVQCNIEVPLRLDGAPRAVRHRVAEQMMRLVRLEDVRRRYPAQLSGGMKMRVSVARALAQAPGLLLMDEPFGALDEITRHRLNEELLTLRQVEEWTGVFVTHSVAEAVFLSHRVLVMAAGPGRIVAEIKIPFPYPRTPELRQERAFHELVGRLTHELRASDGQKVS